MLAVAWIARLSFKNNTVRHTIFPSVGGTMSSAIPTS